MGFPTDIYEESTKLGGRFQSNFGKAEGGKVNDTKAIDSFA